MARIDKGALTRVEIIAEASKQFLEKGYSRTSVSSIAKGLQMSPGNLTFHYPTKEHLLAELVNILCEFHWKSMEKEANDGVSSVMAICLELTAMAAAAEDDEIIRDFFLAAYTAPMCLGKIRQNDAKRAKEVFGAYRPEWTEEDFTEAELLVSGIEYATMMNAGEPVALERRITGALNAILSIYAVPEEVRAKKLERVFAMDYRAIGKRVLSEFRTYVAQSNEQAFLELLKR